MMFLDCPAYLDPDGSVRCGLPAEVRCRFTMCSTDGPVESATIRCPAGHYFCGAIESLTWDRKDTHDPGSAAATSSAGRSSAQGSRELGPHGVADVSVDSAHAGDLVAHSSTRTGIPDRGPH
jgi:hypothetical protein